MRRGSMRCVALVPLLATSLSSPLQAQHAPTDHQVADSLRAAHRELFKEKRHEEARAAAEREISLRRSIPGVDELDVATSFIDLASYLTILQDFAGADSLLVLALGIRRAHLAPDDSLIAKTLDRRLGPLIRLGRLADASAAGEEALAICRTAYGNRHRRTAEAMSRLASVEGRQGHVDARHFERADELLKEATEILSDVGPVDFNLANTVSLRAGLALALGDLAAAERLNAEALAMRKIVHGPRSIYVALMMLQRGRIFRRQGELWDAADIYEEALQLLIEEEYAEQVPDCREALALVYRDLGEHEEAARLARRSIDEWRALHGDDVYTLTYSTTFAELSVLLGDHATADSALNAVDAEIPRLEAEGVDTRELTSFVRSGRALHALHTGSYAEAEASAVELLALERSTLPEGHRSIVSRLVMLAQAAIGQGDLERAESYLDGAIESFELARVKAGSETKAATFVETPYEARAAVRLERGRFLEAWRDLERARGRVLGDLLIGETTTFPIERVQAALAPSEALIGWIDYELLPNDLRSWAYVVRDRRTVKWVSIPNTPRATLRSTAHRLRMFRDEMAAVGRAAFAPDAADFPREDAVRLWRNRLGPLMPHLEGVETLVVVPSSGVAGCPLDALMDSTGAFVADCFAVRVVPSGAVNAWLVERTEALNAVELLALGDPAFTSEHLAKWTPTTRAGVGSVDPSALQRAVRGDSLAFGSLPRLPWSRREVEWVSAIVPNATVLLGADASADNLRELSASARLGDYDVLHLATHALVDPHRPLRSALVLSQVGGDGHATLEPSSDANGGVLTAEEIRAWKLNADLVTLSACETALGREIVGEGLVGFAYQLFVAGARSMLATLWPINDEASALFMRRFYEEWLGPASARGEPRPRTSKAAALRETKRWLRGWTDDAGRRPYAHPYYWAAFVLVGG